MFESKPFIDNIKTQLNTTKVKMQRATKPKNQYEEQDIILWHQYKQGNQTAKWELLKRFEGLIADYANKHSNVRPRNVVEAELKQITLKCFDTYDPNAGAKLSTYIQSHFIKASRANIQNQQAIRLPENIALKYSKYNEGVNYLADVLGRPPTHIETAEHLGWGVEDVEDAHRRFHKELVESKQVYEPGVSDTDLSKTALYSAYYDMTKDERYYLEYTTGFNGKQVKSAAQIQQDLKLTPYQFNKLGTSVATKVKEALAIHEGID